MFLRTAVVVPIDTAHVRRRHKSAVVMAFVLSPSQKERTAFSRIFCFIHMKEKPLNQRYCKVVPLRSLRVFLLWMMPWVVGEKKLLTSAGPRRIHANRNVEPLHSLLLAAVYISPSSCAGLQLKYSWMGIQ